MIHHGLTDCKWGTEPIEEGVQINLLDEDSNQIFHIPFTGEPLEALVLQLVECLNDDQKKKVAMAALSPTIESPATETDHDN